MRALVILLALIVAMPRALGDASVRVIVNEKNPTTHLDKRFIAEAFLKKRTRWGNDSVIQPVDLGPKSAAREKFSSTLLGRTVDAVRRYWSQLVFSGRGVPPPEVSSEEDVVKYVAAHAGAIGYVSANTALTGAKAVEVD